MRGRSHSINVEEISDSLECSDSKTNSKIEDHPTISIKTQAKEQKRKMVNSPRRQSVIVQNISPIKVKIK